MKKERIGFIGTGLMGHGMAKNIVEKGWPLSVIGHRKREAVEDLKTRGASEVTSLKELSAASDIIFLCVTSSKEVEAVVRGAGGLKEHARKGQMIIDCSTANPVSTVALQKELAALGVHFCDVPLGRTPSHAWAGELEAMVGASPEEFKRMEPVLSAWAVKITHLGPVGMGHKMKLINNFIAMGFGALYAEAFNLADKVGINPEQFNNVISGGRMDSGFYQTFSQYAVKGERESHKFTLQNALKDMRYVEAMADDVGFANPLGNAAKNSYAMAIGLGMGDQYVPMLVDAIAHVNGKKKFHA